jgi:transcriptional regulator with XRE-family HTH domain
MTHSKPDLLIIGNRIKTLREEKKIERKKIASLIGITPQAYGNIENGKTDISGTHLIQLAEILKVPIGNLFGQNQGNTYNYTATNNKDGTYVQQVTNLNTVDNAIIEKLFELIDTIRNSSSFKQ